MVYVRQERVRVRVRVRGITSGRMIIYRRGSKIARVRVSYAGETDFTRVKVVVMKKMLAGALMRMN